jgi:hypothetical protein
MTTPYAVSDLERETWLTEAAQFILDDIIAPHCTLPTTEFRISIGFPSGKPSKVLAQCWKHEASADGVNEIFVSPTVSDSVEILAALTHELVHYADNCVSGHQHHFARVARAVGLDGRLTSTVASTGLAERLDYYVSILGTIPHAKLDASLSGKKKQGTRMLKVACSGCDFSFRTTQRHIDSMAYTDCLACDSGTLQTEGV